MLERLTNTQKVGKNPVLGGNVLSLAAAGAPGLLLPQERVEIVHQSCYSRKIPETDPGRKWMDFAKVQELG